jgi:ribonuclease D
LTELAKALTRFILNNDRKDSELFASKLLKNLLPSGDVIRHIAQVVDTEEKLKSFLAMLGSASWVAVDTEADSLHAYPEKLCLIQISTTGEDKLIDPLAPIKLAPLLDALASHEIVMHGADYDLRLFRRHYEFIPKHIFDTMLAARLLGIREFGLGTLVEKYLGVKLEKGPQKANWALRPLNERMEKYARNDTHYLKPLADHLRSELLHKHRLAWHHESCARLIRDTSNSDVSGKEIPWQIRGSNVLTRAGLAVLRELWHWREKEAVSANRPPFFVLPHDLLIELSAAAVRQGSIEELLPRHLSDRRHGGILKAINRGLAVAPELLPKRPRMVFRRPTEGEKHRYLELQKRRDARGHELGIDPTIIASRGTLSDLAHDWHKHSSELMSWQLQLLSP